MNPSSSITLDAESAGLAEEVEIEEAERESAACEFLLLFLTRRTRHWRTSNFGVDKPGQFGSGGFAAKLHLARDRERAQRDREGQPSTSWIAERRSSATRLGA